MSEISRKTGTHYDPADLEAPAGKNVFYYQDGQVPWLYLKVTAFSRTWVFDASLGGKHVKRQIGRSDLVGLPEARMQAYEWKRLLQEGRVPPTVSSRRNNAVKRLGRVSAIFDEYYAHHLRLNARTHSEIARDVDRYWGPIKTLHVSDLTAAVLRAWLNGIAETSGKATANKQRTALQAALRYGASQGLISLPAELFLAVKPFPENERTDYLRPEQLDSLTEALKSESEVMRDAILLHLWTGQRKQNVLALEWSEIDWNQCIWIIPAAKTKSNRPYHAVLSPKAIEILERRKGCHEKYVFPAARASGTGHLVNIDRAWRRVRERGGFANLTIHGLRHTFGTWLALNGGEAFQIQRALNHSSISASLKYVHLVASNVHELVRSTHEALG